VARGLREYRANVRAQAARRRVRVRGDGARPSRFGAALRERRGPRPDGRDARSRLVLRGAVCSCVARLAERGAPRFASPATARPTLSTAPPRRS